MSVYVGAKKAKVYKGYYEPAQIFKGTTKIAGFKTVDKSGTSLTGNDTYNDFLPLTISGKSEQATSVQSVNVWDTTIKTQTVSGITITIAGDKKITLNGTANSAIEIKLSENQWVDTTNKNYICSTGINLQTGMSLFFQDRGGNLRNSILSGQKQTQLQNGYVYIASVLKITGGAIFSNFVFYQQCDEGTTPSNYTPFIPNSPSPDYPSPIRSSENFDVVSCGKNLFDEERILPTQGWVKQNDGSFFVSRNDIPDGKVLWENTDGYTGQIAIAIQNRRIEVGSPFVGAILHIHYSDGSEDFTDGSKVIVWHTDTFISNNSKTVKQITWIYGTGSIGTYVKDLLIAKSNTIIPYQPYHATPAHVTDPLRSVGDVSDSIEVSEGKVEVVRRIAVVKLTGGVTERWSQYQASVGKKYVCMFGNLLPKKLVGDIFCTHAKQTLIVTISGTELGIWAHTTPSFASFMYWGIEYSLIGTNQTSTAEENTVAFRAWLSAQATAGNPVTVQYQIETPTRTDITATPLGQEFLALRTQPKYTNVYTNATIPPMLRSKIKELEL